MFTANPQNGRRDQCVISASWGIGEAVVGGAVTPDVFAVDVANQAILSREIADKRTMTVRRASGTEEDPVPEGLRQVPSLDDAQVVELARLGAEIEALYGMPMDIEWAIEGGGDAGRGFSILQARPITALPEPVGDLPTEWPVEPGMMYMRASITEQLPDPLSPLFETLGHEPMILTIRNLPRDPPSDWQDPGQRVLGLARRIPAALPGDHCQVAGPAAGSDVCYGPAHRDKGTHLSRYGAVYRRPVGHAGCDDE
jgi:pyruvate,water dikinase